MRLDERTDEELALRARAEPRAAFEVLFDRHRGAVWNFLLRQGLDVARAEDLCQTTFLKAWRAIPSFREEAQFKTWLYAIAVNVVADERRTALRRGRPLPLEEAALPEKGATDEGENRADAVERVGLALSRFPADERQLFTLVRFQGLSVAEAAQAVRMSHPAARMKLFRIRKKLGEWFLPVREKTR